MAAKVGSLEEDPDGGGRRPGARARSPSWTRIRRGDRSGRSPRASCCDPRDDIELDTDAGAGAARGIDPAAGQRLATPAREGDADAVPAAVTGGGRVIDEHGPTTRADRASGRAAAGRDTEAQLEPRPRLPMVELPVRDRGCETLPPSRSAANGRLELPVQRQLAATAKRGTGGARRDRVAGACDLDGDHVRARDSGRDRNPGSHCNRYENAPHRHIVCRERQRSDRVR